MRRIDQDQRVPVRSWPYHRVLHVNAAPLEFAFDQLAVIIVTQRAEVASWPSEPRAGCKRRRDLSTRAHVMAIDPDLRGRAAWLRVPRKTIDVIDGVLAEADDERRRRR